MKPYIPRNLDPYTLDDPYPEDFPRARRPFPLWVMGVIYLAGWFIAGIVIVIWRTT